MPLLLAKNNMQYVKELTVSYTATDTKVGEICNTATEAFLNLKKVLGNRPQEGFAVLLLDIRRQIVSRSLVSLGTLTTSLVHPREVFLPAILANAAAIIVGHNHPSGDPSPSREGESVTDRLLKAGNLLGIPVLDHIIIGDDDYFSFSQEGML